MKALGCKVSALFLPWLVWAGGAFAHPELEAQIAALSADLAASSGSAQLYLRRGELYRQHEQWREALLDFEAALKANPGLREAELGAARTLLDAGRIPAALAILNEQIRRYPSDPSPWLLRAQAQRAAGSPAAAAEDFRESLRRNSAPGPEHYLELADCLVAVGEARRPEAVQVLEEGILRLGAVPSLLIRALDLERNLGRYHRALAHVEELIAKSPRKEHWLALRAQLLEEAGARDQAREAYLEAQRQVWLLPARHRRTSATLVLQNQVEDGLARTR